MIRAFLICALSFLAFSPPHLQAETRRALVIGISEYPNYQQVDQLLYADIDAERFTSFLQSGRSGEFTVTKLTNKEANRAAVWESIDDILREPQPDTLFVFSSGHAEIDPRTEQLYLMPSDGNKKQLPLTGIAASQFLTQLRAIGAKNLIVFLDASRSGAALCEKGSEIGDLPKKSVNDLLAQLNPGHDQVQMMFLSAAANESSWEDDEFHQGIFSRSLVKGLGEADGADGTPKDGKITASELKAYLEREVPNRARALDRPVQTPFVSPEFKSDYVLSINRSAAPTIAAPTGLTHAMNAVGQLLTTNPELALMIQTGMLKSNPAFASQSISSDQTSLRTALDFAQWRQVSKLPPTIKTESLINPTISNDGSLLVACIDPADLVVLSLDKPAAPRKFPLKLQTAVSASPVIDSCTISVSKDNRLAAVRINAEDRSSRLRLVSLTEAVAPNVKIEDYDFAAFLDEYLAISKGSTLKLISTNTWTEFLTKDGLEQWGEIDGLTAEADAYVIGVVSSRSHVQAYRVNAHERLLDRLLESSQTDACIMTKDSLVCDARGQFEIEATYPRQSTTGGSECEGGDCRIFPSDTSFGDTWDFMYQGVSQPETVNFGSFDRQHWNSIRLPESVLSGRLLSNGTVVVVGTRGDVYRFDSVRYGDCCRLPGRLVNAFAAGPKNTVATTNYNLVRPETLTIFKDRHLVKQIATHVPINANLVWSRSGETVALIDPGSPSFFGKVPVPPKIRLFTVPDLTAQEVDCDPPITFDETDQHIACIGLTSHYVQLRDARTGKLQREFPEHKGPVQQLNLSDGKLTIAGGYAGRNQILITVWRASDGTLISRRACTVEGMQESKSFRFLRNANYIVQLDNRIH